MYIKSLYYFIFLLATATFSCTKNTKKEIQKLVKPPLAIEKSDTTQLTEAYTFCKKSDMATDFAIFINLKKHSGNYRLVCINLEKKDTLLRGLVTHGHCMQYEDRYAKFSNEVGSNCSSLGKYKIGGKYFGKFGTAYKLHGLDASNSNAYTRFVVLHSHSCVPNSPQSDDICTSEGCPTVSPQMLKKMEPFLDSIEKPILLWIYKS